jgi:Fur family ferric uptake transcriptional regulator
MTVSRIGPTIAAPDLATAEAALRSSGLRLSAARRLVLETLFAADRPLTAEQIADGLDGRFPRSDLASVYRNLETLGKLGLVRHVHLGHGPGLYARAGLEREYLACERCGRFEAVAPEDLDEVRDLVERTFGYRARFGHFPIVGLCADCAGE